MTCLRLKQATPRDRHQFRLGAFGETYRGVQRLDGYGMSKLDCTMPARSVTSKQSAVLQALEIESFHLVGHSMGGLIALASRAVAVRFAKFDAHRPMAFVRLDPVIDKAAIDYDRNMINDFYP